MSADRLRPSKRLNLMVGMCAWRTMRQPPRRRRPRPPARLRPPAPARARLRPPAPPRARLSPPAPPRARLSPPAPPRARLSPPAPPRARLSPPAPPRARLSPPHATPGTAQPTNATPGTAQPTNGASGAAQAAQAVRGPSAGRAVAKAAVAKAAVAKACESPRSVPAVDGWFTVDAGRAYLLGCRCSSCGTVVFPQHRMSFCRNPRCDGERFERIRLSRRGRIWSYTTSAYPPPPPFVPSDPYTPITLVAVELEAEQIVVLGQVAGPGQPEAGLRHRQRRAEPTPVSVTS